jgi:hypothetical protein
VPVFNQIKFTANNRFYLVLERLGNKFEYPEHVAMVGDSHGCHAVFPCLFHHFFDVGGTVEKRKLGVYVQMRKLHIEKRSVKLRTRLARYSDVHKNIVLFSRDDQEMIYSKKIADGISGTVKAEYGLFSMAIQGLLLRLFFFGTKKQPPLRQTIPHTFCEKVLQVITRHIFKN